MGNGEGKSSTKFGTQMYCIFRDASIRRQSSVSITRLFGALIYMQIYHRGCYIHWNMCVNGHACMRVCFSHINISLALLFWLILSKLGSIHFFYGNYLGNLKCYFLLKEWSFTFKAIIATQISSLCPLVCSIWGSIIIVNWCDVRVYIQTFERADWQRPKKIRIGDLS